MKNHVSEMMYLLLGLCILLFVVNTGLILVRFSKGYAVQYDATMMREADRVKRTNLSEIEYTGGLVEMPVTAFKAIYFESGDLIMNMYDCTHIDDNTVPNNIDSTDTNFSELETRSLALINNLDSHTKVKIGVVENADHVGMYDVYIHELRCKGEPAHTTTCKKDSSNSGDTWTK